MHRLDRISKEINPYLTMFAVGLGLLVGTVFIAKTLPIMVDKLPLCKMEQIK